MIVTARRASRGHLVHRWRLLEATLVRERTALGEDATDLDLTRAGKKARDGVETAVVLALAATRHATQEPDCVGVPGVVEDLPGRALLHDLAGVHDPHPVAHLRDHCEVVADEQHRGLESLAQRRDEVEYLGFHRGVEGGRGFVEYEQRGLRGECHGDHDSLQHPARQLVGVGAQHASRIRDLHHPQQFLGARQRLVPLGSGDLVHLGDLTPYSDGRVEGPTGLLVHHRDCAGAESAQGALVHLGGVMPVDDDRSAAEAPVSGQVLGDGEGGGGLAAPRLADEPERLLAPDAERDVAEGQSVLAPHAVGDIEVAHLEGRGRLLDDDGLVGRCCKGHWTSTASIESPMRLIAMMSEAIASAGKSVSHQ